MPSPDLSTLISSTKPNGVLTLDPPRKEFQGPIVIKQPMTIQGQGSTIWAERGPVVVIECAGVTLKDLNIEVTGSEEKLSDDQKCAVIARGTGAVKFDKVGVRGEVDGVPGEERGWRYPRILRLNKLKAGQEHQFRMKLAVPVACKIESTIVGIDFSPRDLNPGSNEVLMKIEKLTEGIRLRGTLRLLAGPVTRRIELSGHITSQGSGITSGMGQLIYEAPDVPGSVPASVGGTVVIPAPVIPPPLGGTVVIPAPATSPGSTVFMPPDVPPPIVPKPAGPPPVPTTPAPTPLATSPTSSRPISKMRRTDSLSPLFGPPPVKEPDPIPEAEILPEEPTAPPEAPPETPSTPVKKKPGLRRTDGLGGLFGG